MQQYGQLFFKIFEHFETTKRRKQALLPVSALHKTPTKPHSISKCKQNAKYRHSAFLFDSLQDPKHKATDGVQYSATLYNSSGFMPENVADCLPL